MHLCEAAVQFFSHEKCIEGKYSICSFWVLRSLLLDLVVNKMKQMQLFNNIKKKVFEEIAHSSSHDVRA